MIACRTRTTFTAVAVLTCLATLGAAPAPATPAPAAAEQVGLKVGTYNIIANVSPAVFRSAVEDLLPLVDVAGLQEVNSHDKEDVLVSLASQGWEYYRPELQDAVQNPVIWNRYRFDFLDARPVRLNPRMWVGKEVPGRHGYVKAMYASVVHLRDVQSGQKISIVNVHLLAGAVKAGKKVPGRPLNFAVYVKQVRNLSLLVREERAWGRVFAMGDLNVGFVADERVQRKRLPYMTFRRKSMPSMWATNHPENRGTHSDALIDQVYSTTAAAKATVAFSLKYSDHYPAIADYQLDVQQASS